MITKDLGYNNLDEADAELLHETLQLFIKKIFRGLGNCILETKFSNTSSKSF